DVSLRAPRVRVDGPPPQPARALPALWRTDGRRRTCRTQGRRLRGRSDGERSRRLRRTATRRIRPTRQTAGRAALPPCKPTSTRSRAPPNEPTDTRPKVRSTFGRQKRPQGA